MRQMSFSMTTEACRSKVKDVTRRLGWANAKPGERIQQIEKGQGLKKGEKVKKIHVIEIVSNRSERLDALLDYPDAADELEREGLPYLTPTDFIERFCAGNRARPDQIINRIAFRYVE